MTDHEVAPRSLSEPEQRLADAAWAIREHAVCPYSGFSVGVALEDDSGQIWTGANVENATFNLGLCAERVALFAALTHGARGFCRVVIATDTDRATPPCGSCRQILWEFAPQAEIVLVTRRAPPRHLRTAELMPQAFDASNLAGS